MVQIQYASDLHIDGWPAYTSFYHFITPCAPILVLAGDVCNAFDPRFNAFLQWCSRNWYFVIFVSGNHDYYAGMDRTMQMVDDHIASICYRLGNVAFLQHGASYRIPGTLLRFVGATLWSAVDPALWEEAKHSKGDCRKIHVAPHRCATPADFTAIHVQHRALLRSACYPQHPYETLIVVTHHMPSLDLLEPHYRGEKWSSFYASDDADLFAPNIAAWICGHGHRAITLRPRSRVGPILCMNARGYNRPDDVGRSTDVYSPTATLQVHVAAAPPVPTAP
jgi:hypothetical protein